MSLDPYKVLGVEKSADASAIKLAYRKLARKYHPDVNPDDRAAEDKFKEISEAYDILSDTTKKDEYDNLGREAFYERGFGGTGYQRPDFSQGGFSFEDIFGDLFGGGAKSAGRRGGEYSYDRGFGASPPPRVGDNLQRKLVISLREAGSGTEVRIELSSTKVCPQCQGQGILSSGGGMRSCPQCGGRGQVQSRESLNVKIPSGIKDGQKVRLRGKGLPGTNGGQAGDLLVEVAIKADPVFTRQERDLRADISINLYDALLGGTVQVPTLNGRAQLKIPAGSQNGTRMRLKGQGMPATKKESAGDLYVTFKVILPTALSEEARELVSRLAEAAPLGSPMGETEAG